MAGMARFLPCLLPGVTGHGAMYEPPARNGFGMSLLASTCPGGSCQWYNQGCEIGCAEITETQLGCGKPVEPTLLWGQDDHLLQYKEDGYGGDTKYHPWRYPGNAPVKDACGVTAGGRQPLGQLDPPPGFSTGYEGKELPKLLEKTEWVAGTTVEVAWGIAANHGGGYQYRLCPASEDPTEECFQKTPLEFVGEDQWLQFGNGYDASQRITVKARRVGGEKVVPKGSTWTMNPIPGCKDTGGRAKSSCSEPTFTPAPGDDKVWKYADGTAKGIFGYGGGYCFGNLTKKPSAACTLEEYKNASFDFGVVDKVKVPDVPEGDYVLSWRWDCEMTKQIWTNCADVTIKKKGQSAEPFSPTKGCSACCNQQICSRCQKCIDKKDGDCAMCWKPLPWWDGRTYWTPRAKAIQCLGFEAKDGGPGTYRPGDSLETPWSPGCPKCWNTTGCDSYVRPLQTAVAGRRVDWVFVTAVALASVAALAGLALALKLKGQSQSQAAREVQAPAATVTEMTSESFRP